jgi:hypothetical protein
VHDDSDEEPLGNKIKSRARGFAAKKNHSPAIESNDKNSAKTGPSTRASTPAQQMAPLKHTNRYASFNDDTRATATYARCTTPQSSNSKKAREEGKGNRAR